MKCRIGVISDTHEPGGDPVDWEKVETAFKDVDLILHAGDVVSLSVIENLKKIAKTEVVAGNMDFPEIKRLIPDQKVLLVGGVKLGMIHHFPVFSDPFDSMNKLFPEHKLNAVIFGHTHCVCNKMINDTLFFNPGSASKSSNGSSSTVGVIEINAGSLKAEIIEI